MAWCQTKSEKADRAQSVNPHWLTSLLEIRGSRRHDTISHGTTHAGERGVLGILAWSVWLLLEARLWIKLGVLRGIRKLAAVRIRVIEIHRRHSLATSHSSDYIDRWVDGKKVRFVIRLGFDPRSLRSQPLGQPSGSGPTSKRCLEPPPSRRAQRNSTRKSTREGEH